MEKEALSSRRVMFAVLTFAGLMIVSAVVVLFSQGRSTAALARKCEALQIGMAEADVVRTMDMMPSAVTEDSEGTTRLKRLHFKPPSLLPNPVAQHVYIEIDASRDRVVRLVCSERFRRRDPLLGVRSPVSLVFVR